MKFLDPELAAAKADTLTGLVARMRERYDWEDVPCVMCGPGVPSTYRITQHDIELRTCDACGHLFVSPRLPEIAVPELYGDAYWVDHAQAVGSPTLEARATFDYQNGFGKLARDVLPYRSGGRLLDVGASNGGMVKAAREAGFTAYGIEPSPETCEIARRTLGIDVICGDVRTVELPAGCFDIVTLHDVLEHVFDPNGVLAACRRLLSASGLLVIEMPTTDSIDWYLGAHAWTQLHPLEHVNLFSERNAARIVERAGFTVVDLYCPHENNVIVIGEVA